MQRKQNDYRRRPALAALLATMFLGPSPCPGQRPLRSPSSSTRRRPFGRRSPDSIPMPIRSGSTTSSAAPSFRASSSNWSLLMNLRGDSVTGGNANGFYEIRPDSLRNGSAGSDRARRPHVPVLHGRRARNRAQRRPVELGATRGWNRGAVDNQRHYVRWPQFRGLRRHDCRRLRPERRRHSRQGQARRDRLTSPYPQRHQKGRWHHGTGEG